MVDKDRTASNGGLARIVAEVADALAEYDHLPAIASISVDTNRNVYISPQWREQLTVARWAEAFGTPVVIDMSSSGWLRTIVPFGAFEARIETYIAQRGAYELGAALQIPVSPGGQVEVTAEALLAVLDGEPVRS